MRNIFTKVFAVMAMSMMSLTAWGANAPTSPGTPVSIPTALNGFIDFNNATCTNCNVEDDGIKVGLNIGSTHSNTIVSLVLTNSTAQDYYLTLKTGHKEGSALLEIKVKQGETELFADECTVINTAASNWNPVTIHTYFLGTLPIADEENPLTLDITVKRTTGSTYAGNWGTLAIRGANQYKGPIPSETALDLSKGRHGKLVDSAPNIPQYQSDNQNIGFIKKDGYSVYDTIYMSEAAYLDMKMGVTKYPAENGQIQVRIFDIIDMENAEIDQTFDIPSTSSDYEDKTFSITKGVTVGFKVVRFDYSATNYENWIMNYNNLRFTKRGDYKYIKKVTIDGKSMSKVGLYALKDDGGSFTFSDNIYTNVLPVVTAKFNDDTDASVSRVEDGTNVVFTLTDNSAISSVLTVEGYHPYSAGTHDETVQLKCRKVNEVVSVDHDGYTLTGPSVDGNDNSIFKFNATGDYTLSIPENLIVKQLIIKDWALNYYGYSPSYITAVTSTGANVYLPTHNEATYNAPYDVVINLENHVAGTPIVIHIERTTQIKGWFELKVQPRAYWREHPHMNLNTLCFPYQIDAYTGATFYTILETEVEAGNLTKLVLEEHEGPLTAGTPYFYDPTEGADELVCYYSGAEQATPLTAANGAFIGAYADNTDVPENSYVTVNNQLYKCGTGVTLAEYRAYVRPVAYARAATPGRRLLTIGGKNTPTDVEIVNSDALIVKSQKILRNGQLLIIHDGKTYNVQGQLIEK